MDAFSAKCPPLWKGMNALRKWQNCSHAFGLMTPNSHRLRKSTEIPTELHTLLTAFRERTYFHRHRQILFRDFTSTTQLTSFAESAQIPSATATDLPHASDGTGYIARVLRHDTHIDWQISPDTRRTYELPVGYIISVGVERLPCPASVAPPKVHLAIVTEQCSCFTVTLERVSFVISK